MENTRLRVWSSLFRHIYALAEGYHQRVQEALLFLFMIVFTKNRLNCFGGLLGVVEGDSAKKVVDDMVIDNFVEEVTTNEAGCAVNCSQSSLGIGPGLCGVVWNSRVGVLKVRDSNCKSS